MKAPLPADEAERLEALLGYDILDSEPDQEFDDLVHLAAQICETPISVITLIDQERQWFKSRVGFDISEIHRDTSFCAHTILGKELLVVPDVRADERFADNPFVTAEPKVRFYAGVPLVTPEGLAVGTLCVTDIVPRELGPEQQDALRRLGRQAVALLEARLGSPAARGQTRRVRQQAERERLALAARQAQRDTDNLKFSEVRYRRLFEAARDGILILDAASGQIEDVNPFLCQLLGYEASYFLGKQLWEIGFFGDHAANQEAFRVLQEKGYIRYEDLPLRTQAGKSVSVEFVSNVYMCAEKEVIQCNIRDLSAQKRAVTEQERFFALSLDMLCVLDKSGAFERVNPAFAEVLGFRPDELIGRLALDFLHPEDRAPSESELSRLAVGLPVNGFVNRFRRRDGSYLTISWVSVPYGDQLYAAGRDITERELAEAALRESEEIFSLAFRSSPLALVITTLDGKFAEMNPAFCKLVGHSREELVGKSAIEAGIVTGPECEKLASVIERRGGSITNLDLKFRVRDGSLRDVTYSTTDITLRGVAHRLSTGLDVTQRKEADKIVAELQRFLQSTLDALTSHIAVLDENGKIIAVNSDWRQFISANGGDISRCGVGSNYLETCDRAEGAYGEEGALVAQGIRDVMALRQPSFRLEYPCHSPREQRWFNVTVTRFTGEGPVRVVVAHENITERKLAEVRLQASEANLASAQQMAHLGSWELDLANTEDINANPLRWSEEIFRIFGYSPREFEPSNEAFFRAVHPDDRDTVIGIMAEAVDGGKPYSVEHRILLPDGRERTVHSRAEMIRDAVSGQPLKMVGTGQDITERRQAEAALRESETRYRALAEAAPDDIFIVDRSGIMKYLNHHAAQQFGLRPEEIIGKPQRELFPPEFAAAIELDARRVFESGKPIYEETLLPFRDKVTWRGIWLVPLKGEVGEVVEIMGVARDISAQKQAEVTLRESESRYRSLFESNPQPMWVYDLETLRFLDINDAAIFHYGYSKDEFLDMTIKDIRPPGDIPALLETVSRPALINGKQGIWRHRKKDGTLIEVELSTHELSFEGRPARLALAHDITARRLAERALQQAKDELELRVERRTAQLATVNESLRIENVEHHMTMGTLRQVAQALQSAKEEADGANRAKSEFLSRMSHELRTPLNAILGFGQILDRQEMGPRSKESIGYILKGGRHLLNLINEVLDIARVEAGHLEVSLEPVALVDVVPDACALVNPLAAERQIRLEENSCAAGDCYVLADLQRLKQVLINLLSNAIKYNREGGHVQVSCEPKPNGLVAISVRDSGPGLSPDDISRLFTPFERLGAATSSIEGTGLGLVLSRRLVMAMGGTLSVQSTPGRGSTFTLELPRAAAPDERVTNVPEEIRPLHGGEELERVYSVLCIEDNPSNLRLTESIFESRPEIRLLVAMQGGVGLDLARKHEPDLILLDLDLPDIHGSEVLARLQRSAITRNIPVIIVSADATPNQTERLLAAGAKAYLTKPLDVGRFLDTVDQFLQLPDPIAPHPIATDLDEDEEIP